MRHRTAMIAAVTSLAACGDPPVTPHDVLATDATVLDAPIADALDAAPDRSAPDARPDVVDAAVDAGPPDVQIPDPPGNDTFTFVVDGIRLTPRAVDPSAPADRTVTYGFDLDQRFTLRSDPRATGTMGNPGCGQPDTFALYDDDQNTTMRNTLGISTGMPCRYDGATCTGGVDDGLLSVLQTVDTLMTGTLATAQQNLDSQVGENHLAIIVRITRVGDLQNDPTIGLAVYLGYPTFTTDCETVRPDRQYTISDAYLQRGTDLDADAALKFDARIVDGRVDAQLDTDDPLTVVLVGLLAGNDFTLKMYKPHLRFDVSPDGASGSRGNLGAYVPFDTILDAVNRVPGLQMYASVARTVLAAAIDVRVDTTCNDEARSTPPAYGGLGVGLGLSMVRATLAPAAAASATPGVCGTIATE